MSETIKLKIEIPDGIGENEVMDELVEGVEFRVYKWSEQVVDRPEGGSHERKVANALRDIKEQLQVARVRIGDEREEAKK